MKASDDVIPKLEGEHIKKIFKNAEQIAELHATLTSSRGDFFRMKLLNALEVRLSASDIVKLRDEAGLRGYHRHLNKLLKFNLVQKDGDGYVRTELGEEAINTLRELERRISQDAARKIYEASLGPNSIRLFLRVYGHKTEVDFEKREISFTPAEIGRLSFFLPRTIEGISAIDKLSDADILVYKEDNCVYMHPIKARSFYQYLQKLDKILGGEG